MLNEQSALRTDLNRTLSLEAETMSRINELRRQLERTPKDVSFEKGIDSNQLVISGLQVKLVGLNTRTFVDSRCQGSKRNGGVHAVCSSI